MTVNNLPMNCPGRVEETTTALDSRVKSDDHLALISRELAAAIAARVNSEKNLAIRSQELAAAIVERKENLIIRSQELAAAAEARVKIEKKLVVRSQELAAAIAEHEGDLAMRGREIVDTFAERVGRLEGLAVKSRELAGVAEDGITTEKKLEVRSQALISAIAERKDNLATLSQELIVVVAERLDAQNALASRSQELVAEAEAHVETEKILAIRSRQLAEAIAERVKGEEHLAVRSQELASAIAERTVSSEARDTLVIRGLQLEKSNAELEQFAHVASHDLREPLRLISSFLTLLDRRNPLLDDESKEFLEYAKTGAVRLDRLVLALLAYSRVGQPAFTHRQVEMTNVIEAAMSNLSLSIKESGSDVVVTGPMPVVVGNEDELTLLFQNLIGNAIKYRHPSRPATIAVTYQRDEGDWRFSVSDNGIGIGVEYFDLIFQIFQRLHTSKTYEGSGIGLAICRRIVDHHNGRLWLESKADEGSTFHFTLPCSDQGLSAGSRP